MLPGSCLACTSTAMLGGWLLACDPLGALGKAQECCWGCTLCQAEVEVVLGADGWYEQLITRARRWGPALGQANPHPALGPELWPSEYAEGQASKCLGSLNNRRNFMCNCYGNQIATLLPLLWKGRWCKAFTCHALAPYRLRSRSLNVQTVCCELLFCTPSVG